MPLRDMQLKPQLLIKKHSVYIRRRNLMANGEPRPSHPKVRITMGTLEA